MKYLFLFVIAILFAACPMANAQPPADIQPSIAEYQRPTSQKVLVGYVLKENFGGKFTIGSTVVITDAFSFGNADSRLMTDLIAALAREGKLSKIKGFTNDKQASLTIISWAIVRAGFEYSTEKPTVE
jgi:hypothetical protein